MSRNTSFKNTQGVCISIPFQLREHGEVGTLQKTASTQSCCMNDGWYHRRAAMSETCSSCCGKCYILEGSVLLQQKLTRIASCFVSLVLCCTSKYVSPLLTHMAVRKEICLKDLWLASYPHPAAAAMSFWRKTGSCHLLLYQLLSTGTIYSLRNIEVWPLLYNGDCNASAEMLVHWGSATDSESGPWDKQ